MKKQFLFIALWIAASAFTLSAQPSIQQVVESNWVGHSIQKSNLTKSGEITLSQTLNLTMSEDYTVRGTSSTTINFDGIKYSCTTKVKGTYNDDDKTLDLDYSPFITKDALPYELYWCLSWGKLRISGNKNKPGHYLLYGNLKDDCSGGSYIEYFDQ